jgi:hypothetical protein
MDQAFEGWRLANGIDDGPKPLTNAEHDALIAKYAHVQPGGHANGN